MTFAQWVHLHHRSLLFGFVVFAIAGLFAGVNTPVSLFPQVTFPRVVVSVDAGDRPAERMAIEVTWPIEEVVRAVPGVHNVRSNTSRGSADISVNFDWGIDMIAAMLQVESAINQIRAQLPAAASFRVRRMDPTVFPVLGYSLTSDTHSSVELRDMALYQIRPMLSTVSGVARVGVLGGDQAEFQVLVDPARLHSFGLALTDVARALSASNVIQAVGRLEENYKLYLILSNTQFDRFEQIEQTVLRSGNNGVVLLEDVADIQRGVVPKWTRVTADGHDAVLFQIYQQPGGNTVQIAADSAAQLQQVRKILPPDIRINNWYDQSDLIMASASSVRHSLLIGVTLAIAILLLFLKNIKVTLIAGITVPMTLAATALLLYLLGMSLNVMTLGGMAAAVGLIIDDAIVMIEHIIRRLREGTGSYSERVNRAAAEFTAPLAGSSASTIIIFAPLAFLTGVTGAFFKALSLTMAAGLVISFAVTWLAVPLLALNLLRRKDAEQEEGGRITDAFHRAYCHVMNLLLPRPWLIVPLLGAMLVAGYCAWNATGSGFLPSMDEGGFILDYRAPAGTSLSETDRLLRQVEKILHQTPEVETYSRRTGLSLGGHITEASEGDFFVRLTPLPRRGLGAVMDGIREKIEQHVLGLDIELAKLMEDLIGDLTAVPQPIEIKLFSDDGHLLQQLAPKIAARIETIPGVVDVNNGIVLAGDALDIRVDRVRAALDGFTPEQVTAALRSRLYGDVTTQVKRGPKMVGVRVWIPEADRRTISKIEQMRLRAPDGHLVPLKRIAAIEPIIGQPQISRDDLKRMVAVTARISARDMGSTVADVITTLDAPGVMPRGVYYTLGGLYEQQQIAFRGLIGVFAAAVALVFMLLLFLYERFHVALAMMITTLSALAAVFIGLWLTKTELNITAMMGMTMIVGIVTEVAIFYYSEYQSLAEEQSEWERLILAGRNRMRPIAMTTFATIFALAPLALGFGEGSAMLQPLAIAILSGLIVQLPLVLLVLPVLLTTFRSLVPTASSPIRSG
jgi:CzcA family heavy metal efflux pump